MFAIKTLVSQYSRLCKRPLINPYEFARNPDESLLISFVTKRSASSLAQLEIPGSQESQKATQNGDNTLKKKRPLDVVFKEAIGLCERKEIYESGIEANGDEDAELKKKLWDLEMQLRELKAKSEEQGSNLRKQLDDKAEDGGSRSKPKSLYKVFVGGNEGRETLFGDGDGVVLKEISEDIGMLLRHFYDKGYFKDANFMPKNKFNISYFDSAYARGFLKCVVERFGEDNQHISEWLTGSDLKTVALFGCPSKKKREVFAAKRLRTFLGILEENVCEKCRLKGSCKFVNQTVWTNDNKNLRLDLLMRLLSTYSLEATPPELKLTDDVKASVSRLIYEVINLTKSSA